MKSGSVAVHFWSVLGAGEFSFQAECGFDCTVCEPAVGEIRGEKVSGQREQYLSELSASSQVRSAGEFGQRPVGRLYSYAGEISPPRYAPTQRTKPVKALKT